MSLLRTLPLPLGRLLVIGMVVACLIQARPPRSAAALDVTYTVSGYVLQQNGSGISGAQVFVEGVTDLNPPNASDSTDFTGYFSATVSGSYWEGALWVRVTHDDYWFPASRMVVVERNSARGDVNFVGVPYTHANLCLYGGLFCGSTDFSGIGGYAAANALVLTHGWCGAFEADPGGSFQTPQFGLPDPIFLGCDAAVNPFVEIGKSIMSQWATDQWEAVIYDWGRMAGGIESLATCVDGPRDRATILGRWIGEDLVDRGYLSMHAIGHSAGANLINEISRELESGGSGTWTQLTFLDAFIGCNPIDLTRISKANEFGESANFAEHYFTRINANDATITDTVFENAINYDVTRSQNCSGLFCGHGTPVQKYEQSTWQIYCLAVVGEGCPYVDFGFLTASRMVGMVPAHNKSNCGSANSYGSCARGTEVIVPGLGDVTFLDSATLNLTESQADLSGMFQVPPGTGLASIKFNGPASSLSLSRSPSGGGGGGSFLAAASGDDVWCSGQMCAIHYPEPGMWWLHIDGDQPFDGGSIALQLAPGNSADADCSGGEPNGLDALAVLQALGGLPSGDCLSDVNASGQTDLRDALCIRRLIVGLVDHCGPRLAVPLQNGVPQQVRADDFSDQKVGWIDVPAGATVLAYLTNLTGELDMYGQFEGTTTYPCLNPQPGTNGESCAILMSQAGRLEFGLLSGWAAEATLTVHVTGGGVDNVVQFCRHTYYWIDCEQVIGTLSYADLSATAIGNDQMSSFSLPFGWSAVVYADTNWTGDTRLLCESHPDFNWINFNDVASSIVIWPYQVPACVNAAPFAPQSEGVPELTPVAGR